MGGGSLLETFSGMLTPSEKLRSRFISEEEVTKMARLRDAITVYRIWKQNRRVK